MMKYKQLHDAINQEFLPGIWAAIVGGLVRALEPCFSFVTYCLNPTWSPTGE